MTLSTPIVLFDLSLIMSPISFLKYLFDHFKSKDGFQLKLIISVKNIWMRRKISQPPPLLHTYTTLP